MPQFRSNENPMFRSKFSEDIFKHKYAHHGCETWDALSSVLVDDVVVTSTMQVERISFLIIVIYSKQRKIPEKIGQTSHGSLSPVL
jgi:hypothetical protein